LTFGPRASLSRRQHGGGQERGRRAGTENVPGISGFGAASKAAVEALKTLSAQARWRDATAARLQAAGAVVIGETAPRLPNTLCLADPGAPAELQVMQLDLAGVMVSAGSACSSGKVKASHVLTAMGWDALAGCAIRVSGGWATTEDDWNRLAQAWLAAHERRAERRNQRSGAPAGVGVE
jgi:cysteine desulfurase